MVGERGFWLTPLTLDQALSSFREMNALEGNGNWECKAGAPTG